MEEIVPIFITGIVFFSFVAIIKILSDNRLRNRLVDKGIVDENVKYLFQPKQVTQPLASIKWGMILVAIGLALLVIQILPHNFEEEGALGLVLVLAGIALFIYYYIANRKQKTEQSQ